MALELHVRYPAQVLLGGADYPFGQARNVTVPGDGTGTPFEADLVNDWLGFLQGLLLAAGINPSFTPDTAIASQYRDAIRYIATHPESDIIALSNGVSAKTFTVLSSGTFFGSTVNLLVGPTRFVGTAQFDDTSQFNQQLTVNLPGIVVGATGVDIGNGLPGIIIQAGGLQVLVGNAEFSDTAEFRKEVVLSNEGRIRRRPIYAANADTHHDVTQGDVLIIKATVSATRVYTIDDLGASDGSGFEIHNHSASTQTIKNQGGTTIGTLPAFGPHATKAYLSWEDDSTGSRWVYLT